MACSISLCDERHFSQGNRPVFEDVLAFLQPLDDGLVDGILLVQLPENTA